MTEPEDLGDDIRPDIEVEAVDDEGMTQAEKDANLGPLLEYPIRTVSNGSAVGSVVTGDVAAWEAKMHAWAQQLRDESPPKRRGRPRGKKGVDNP